MLPSKKSIKTRVKDVDKKDKSSKTVESENTNSKHRKDRTRIVLTSKKSKKAEVKDVDKKGKPSKKVESKSTNAKPRKAQKSDKNKNKEQKTTGVDVDTIKHIVAEIVEQYYVKKKKRVISNSDSEFENPMPKRTQKRKRASKLSQDIELYDAKIVDKKQKVNNLIESDDETNESDDGLKALRTRTSPLSLVTAIRIMNQVQKEWITEAGFGSILEMQIDKLPTHLGYYVVDNFDETKMKLKTKYGSIKITEQLVKEMLGIPNGDIKIYSEKNVNVNDPVTNEWRNQYTSRVVRLKEVVEKLGESQVPNRLFQLNFLVLFVSVMGECTKQGGCNQKFLPCITKNVEIKNLNWCGYILECLKNSKQYWYRHKQYDHYAGPITLLLLLYVDRVRCGKLPISRQRPAIIGWTPEMLKKRESIEMKSGGFGLGEIVNAFTDDSDKEEVDLNCNKKGTMDDDLIKEPTTLEDYLHNIEVTYTRILDQKKHVESTLVDAMTKFPTNNEIRKWNDKIDELFGNNKQRHGSFSVGISQPDPVVPVDITTTEICNPKPLSVVVVVVDDD